MESQNTGLESRELAEGKHAPEEKLLDGPPASESRTPIPILFSHWLAASASSRRLEDTRSRSPWPKSRSKPACREQRCAGYSLRWSGLGMPRRTVADIPAPGVLKLGFSYLSSASLPVLAQRELERITENTHESSSLSVRDGDEIVYVARSSTKRVMSIALSVGSRLSAYCTSMGRVLLSALTEEELTAYLKRLNAKAYTPKTVTSSSALAKIIRRARSDQFALTDGELELGLRSIAVPVRNRQSQVVAAMNIGVHAARVSSKEMIQRFLPVLQESARNLSQYLG